MRLEHIAIWTNRLEELKAFYVEFFGASASSKYVNSTTNFQSYFLTFESGARLEIMTRPDIPNNANDTVNKQHIGLIHMAFEVPTMKDVDDKAKRFEAAGIKILRAPRKTGDGYYEFEMVDLDNNRIEVTTLYRG